MDPVLAFTLGALSATVVLGGAGAVWWVRFRPRPPTGAVPAVEAPTEDLPDAEPRGLAGLVPLVFSPVHALLDVVDAANTEVRSLFAPGGHVGLLFSDIVGSTRLNRRLGDEAWAALVARHDELTGQVVRSHGGRIVKRQGDGFFAAFHDADDAVRAGLALHRAVTVAAGELEELQLRVGIHHGQVVTKAGDYFGVNVATAARIAGAAAAGELLVSEDVVEALGRFADEVTLVPRDRPERLEGISGRHRLVAVSAG